MIAAALSGLILATLAMGALLAASHARRWRAGAAAKVDLVGGVLALPRRYLVDVHDVVARKPFNARFHALTAGGFLASLPLIALAAVPAFRGWPLWALLSVCAGGDAWRRAHGRLAAPCRAARRTVRRPLRRLPLALAGLCRPAFSSSRSTSSRAASCP